MTEFSSANVYFVINKCAHLVLSRVSDETLGVCEGNIGGSGSITLIVCNDLHLNRNIVNFQKFCMIDGPSKAAMTNR
jgi:hypothetical protein